MEKNSCPCARRNRRYGVLSSLNSRGVNCSACSDNSACCRAGSDCPGCTTCSGSPLFYTGCCGRCKNSECGSCACNECGSGNYNSYSNCNNGNCNNSCNEYTAYGDCGCGSSWNELPYARVSPEMMGSGRYSYPRQKCDGCSRQYNENRGDCGCSRQHNENRSDWGCSRCNESSHCVFTASCPVSVCDGGFVAMEMESGDSSCFRESGGCVHILKNGIYEVIYSLNLPEGVSSSSCLALSLDDERIYHSAAPVDVCNTDHNCRFTGHGVINVRRGQRLALRVDGGLEIPANSGAFPAVQMTLIRLG